MNIHRAANAVRRSADARPHGLSFLVVGALLLPSLFLLLSATDAQAAPLPMGQEVLYGVVPAAGGADSMLVTVDLSALNAGTTADVGLIGFPGVTGLAFADENTLFAVSNGWVLKIDLTVPGVVDVEQLTMPLGGPVHDLDFSGGVLFGIQDIFSDGAPTTRLVEIETTSGDGTVSPVDAVTGGVTGGQGGPGNGLAFASDSGALTL